LALFPPEALLPAHPRYPATPLSNHLFEVLREPLRQYVPDDNEYDAAFDWFEYLICLAHIDQQTTRPSSKKKRARRPTSIFGRLLGVSAGNKESEAFYAKLKRTLNS
jgi:hypothetical protein